MTKNGDLTSESDAGYGLVVIATSGKDEDATRVEVVSSPPPILLNGFQQVPLFHFLSLHC